MHCQMIFPICLSASPACWSIGFGYVATTPPRIGCGKLGESWSWLLGAVNPWTHEASEPCRQNSESWILFEGFIYQNKKGFIKAEFLQPIHPQVINWNFRNGTDQDASPTCRSSCQSTSSWLFQLCCKWYMQKTIGPLGLFWTPTSAMLFISKAVQHLPAVSGLLDSDLSSSEFSLTVQYIQSQRPFFATPLHWKFGSVLGRRVRSMSPFFETFNRCGSVCQSFNVQPGAVL